jgi:hypothetical protein
MITQYSYLIYRYSKVWYFAIGIASFIISILLLPTIQGLVAKKISEGVMLSVVTYLIAFILATIVLPHLGYWFVKNQMSKKVN